MRMVAAHYVARELRSSTVKPRIAPRVCIYYHFGALFPLSGIRSAYQLVYKHGTDFVAQIYMREMAMPPLRCTIIKTLTTILHKIELYVQTLSALREWTTPTVTSNISRTVIHADRRPSIEHIRRYDGSFTFKVAAIIPVAGNEIVSCKDIVFLYCGSLNSAINEVFETVPGTNHVYNPLSYVSIFPFGDDGWLYSAASLKLGSNFQSTES